MPSTFSSPVAPVAMTLPLCLLLAACASDDTAQRPMHVAARADGDILRLSVEYIPAGREIVALALVDQRGRETLARDRELVTRETGSGGNSGPGIGIGATGGSSSGVQPYFSLGYLFSSSSTTERSQRMTAEIPLAEPAAYAEGYRDWHIEVRYRDQLGELQQVAIPAPPP